jgi:hypothetical protein
MLFFSHLTAFWQQTRIRATGRFSFPVAGVLVSLTWHRIVISYRNLNSVKFEVIHELEQQLPAALYEYEWKKAQEGRGGTYHPLTHLEQWVPVVFMTLYALLAVLGLLGPV